jgi:hypothetical protein
LIKELQKKDKGKNTKYSKIAFELASEAECGLLNTFKVQGDRGRYKKSTFDSFPTAMEFTKKIDKRTIM